MKKGVIPSHAQHLQVHFCNYLKFTNDYTDTKDPLFKYKLEFNIDGYRNPRYNGAYSKNSWHLVRHSPSKTDKYTHPSYHFQFGGKKIKNVSTGDLLIMGAPRIPHPPMDVFLGFHFVFSNFFDRSTYEFVGSIMEDIRYKKIIKRAQERLWTPYFKGFDTSHSHHDFTLQNIFPLYIH